MTQPGVGYAVIKGEAISKSNSYRIRSGHYLNSGMPFFRKCEVYVAL
jgi:hypothetical protein